MPVSLIRRKAATVAGLAGRHLLAFGVIAALLMPGGPSASEAETALPPPGWHLAFDEPFDRLDTARPGPGRWDYAYPGGFRTNQGNQELEYYVDPRPGYDAPALAGLRPFSIRDGVLSIRANPIPESDRRASKGLAYASGMLTTYGSFSFQYGYVEMRARVPNGLGLWPALWLLARAGGWPPEIDVMEVYGDRLSTLDVTLHTNEGGKHRQAQRKVPVPDLSEGFHIYAVKWTADEITWYFDGASVFSAPTPADMHQPMFLLVNLAVGGTWTGTPDDTTRFPADFEVDWIRVFTPDSAARKAAAND